MTNLVKVTLLFLGAVLSVDCTAQKSEKMRFSISENKLEKRIDILIDGQPFTSYIYPDVLTKPVLYPLRTSRGTLIIRGWPMDPRQGERVDHPHHVGMWFNYGDVNGMDFWNSYPDMPADKRNAYGVIKHRRILRMKSSDVNAELEVELDWEKPDGKVLLKEHTRFVFAGQGDNYPIS